MDENATESPESQGPETQAPAPDQQVPPPQASAEVPSNARTMAMLCHLLGILGFLGPLIVWLIKKDDHAFVDQQGKEALNWQLTLLIVWVGGMLSIWVPLVGCVVGLVLTALWVANLVLCILGAVKANEGQPYVYPVKISFLK